MAFGWMAASICCRQNISQTVVSERGTSKEGEIFQLTIKSNSGAPSPLNEYLQLTINPIIKLINRNCDDKIDLTVKLSNYQSSQQSVINYMNWQF